ncbi:hypothetical protein ACIGCK_05515 [Microbacterium sp. NPDC078428]|uniref:hypothetical protein n=1 Tax=Microbacterium sp. NPDC078428 TaxID=3364190 RepID=UPI0037C57780
MNSEEALDTARAIIDTLPDETSGLWKYYASQGRESDWLHDILARVVLITAQEQPIFVDGSISDDDGPSGFILVATDSTLVRAEFTPDEGSRFSPGVKAIVESVPRSAVLRVTALTAHPGQPQRPWPLRAQVRIDLDRELTGTTSITLPSDTNAVKANAERLFALVRHLHRN